MAGNLPISPKEILHFRIPCTGVFRKFRLILIEIKSLWGQFR